MASLQGLCFCNQYNNQIKIPEFRSRRSCIRRPVMQCEGGDSVKKLRILIAGGGIGGLVLALAAKKKGFEVRVLEKDLSAARGEGRQRGPIQLNSNAFAVLESIDKEVARQIIEAGCITGDRINGIADGLSGEWFVKLDLLNPALERGLPFTQMICRMTMQDILLNAVGTNLVCNRSKVVDFKEDSDKVTAILEDGRRYEGDILVGADGLWSKVRSKLFGWQEAKYSNFTCYTGIVNYVPPYIDTVAYKVFLGPNQYFAFADIGDGKMQWYGFNKEPPGNTDPPRGKKKRLLELFGHWCDEVTILIMETPEPKILRRDIYDRDMLHCWSRGRVTLLGDSAHPVQPNFGQGGCMAIEDSYQLIQELEKVIESDSDAQMSKQIASALKRFERKRMICVNIIHLMNRMASGMVAFYQPYLDFGSGSLSFLTNLQIKNHILHGSRIFCSLECRS